LRRLQPAAHGALCRCRARDLSGRQRRLRIRRDPRHRASRRTRGRVRRQPGARHRQRPPVAESWILRSRRAHRFARRRTGPARSLRCAAQRGAVRHRTLHRHLDQHEQGTSDGQLDFGGGFLLPTSFALTRDSLAPFAELRAQTHFGLSAQAGLRVDDPDGYSAVTSPRLPAAWEIWNDGSHDDVSVAASWGKAFKLPSMYALGHPLVGNPDLQPERSESWELEFSQTLLDG